MDEHSIEYKQGYNDAWLAQQVKVCKIIKLVETYLEKYDVDYDFLNEIYKISCDADHDGRIL